MPVREKRGRFPWGRGVQMMRQLAVAVFVLLIAVPAFPDVREAPTGQVYPALHLMSNNEFILFLRRLDTAALRWKVHLGHLDVKSLNLNRQAAEELERNYYLCLQSLDNTREEIQKL